MIGNASREVYVKHYIITKKGMESHKALNDVQTTKVRRTAMEKRV